MTDVKHIFIRSWGSSMIMFWSVEIYELNVQEGITNIYRIMCDDVNAMATNSRKIALTLQGYRGGYFSGFYLSSISSNDGIFTHIRGYLYQSTILNTRK